eukprot:CAMPEP_0182433774 /NCGR_PEP_ID=MMETSP1167-20130531/65534_1 /TAXON_ID=2988 /ORGANISM="Mallomonas Sp, Strain CCMP3275" /LENGTH=42 /DNA_ID= /DNA_START= /DNA_END= /DNA_ORIENTATION=
MDPVPSTADSFNQVGTGGGIADVMTTEAPDAACLRAAIGMFL